MEFRALMSLWEGGLVASPLPCVVGRGAGGERAGLATDSRDRHSDPRPLPARPRTQESVGPALIHALMYLTNAQHVPGAVPGTGIHKVLVLLSQGTQITKKSARQFQDEMGGWERERVGNRTSWSGQASPRRSYSCSEAGDGKMQTQSFPESRNSSEKALRYAQSR